MFNAVLGGGALSLVARQHVLDESAGLSQATGERLRKEDSLPVALRRRYDDSNQSCSSEASAESPAKQTILKLQLKLYHAVAMQGYVTCSVCPSSLESQPNCHRPPAPGAQSSQPAVSLPHRQRSLP